MKIERLCVCGVLVVALGCQADRSTKRAVQVSEARASKVDTQRRGPSAEQRVARDGVDQTGALPGASPDPNWMPKLKDVCRQVGRTSVEKASTAGWEKWKDQLDVTIQDFRIYSPDFKKWTLQRVDDPTKVAAIRHRGPFFGYGLVVEVENKSDQVLTGDDVYAWATFESKTGKHVCFGTASADRSWNPFAKKGVGAWVKEKDYSEVPLRPTERKRYTVVRSLCFTSMFVETEPTKITVEVYTRFRPLGGETVIAGPFHTLERNGGILRGLALTDTETSFQRKTKKGLEPVRALFTAGDHVLLAEAKKSTWVPIHTLVGPSPLQAPKVDELPDEAPLLNKAYDKLTLKVDDWRVTGWRTFKGVLKQGHKMVSARVSISVDTSAVTKALEGAVAAANTSVTTAQAGVTAKEAALGQAQTSTESAKGTDNEAKAKDALKAAKDELKVAKAALKAAEKAQKAATKAMAGGMKAFLSAQVKAVNCGSFQLDIGRKSQKTFKGSLSAKDCKALLTGAPVTRRIWFELERWDMPFMLSWKGLGGSLETHRLASRKLATVLKD